MTFLGNLNLSLLLDVAYMCLIGGCIGWCMIRVARIPDAQSERWKADLTELERSLRRLIEDATVASAALDRALTRRKVELEEIVRRVERAKAEFGSEGEQSLAPLETTPVSGEEFPNSSWVTGSSAFSRAGYRGQATPRDTPYELHTEAITDTVKVSSASPRAKKVTREAEPSKRPSLWMKQKDGERRQELAERLARQRAVEYGAEDDEELGHSDPLTAPLGFEKIQENSIARTVARRLLSRGQEIHVVARKVGLSLEEIRAIDREGREENPLMKRGATDIDLERELSLL